MKLALVGSKGSGKNYLSNKLIQYKGYNEIAFADSLKDYCNKLYPNLEKYNTHEAKDIPVPEDWNKDNETPRDIWERVSREKALEDDRFFHKMTLKQIDTMLNISDKLVVTDVRNKHEYEQLEKDNFTVIYITRPDKEIFQGYDGRIKEFYENIKYTYSNETDGVDFIRMVTALEELNL